MSKPFGTVAGDVMIATVAERTNGTITAPSGWTLIQKRDNLNTTANSLAIYYRVAGAAEGASYTFKFNDITGGAAGAISSFSGVDVTFPIDVFAGQNTPLGFLHAAPSITPTHNNAAVLSMHSYASSNPWSPPVGMTEDVDVNSAGAPSTNGISLETNHLLQSGFAAATGALTATTPDDANIDVGNAIVIALQPANTAPVLDTTKSPALGTLNEDPGPPLGPVGTLVSSLVDFASPSGQVDNVVDSDPGALLGMALTAVDPQVTAYYSLNDGSSWTAIGAVSNTTALLLAADADNRIYLQPAANLNGTLSSALTFRAWDQTAGMDGGFADATANGGATAFSSATDTLSLTVNAVNDAPTATNLSAAEMYTEDTPLNLVDIVLSDVDNTTTTATLTLSNSSAGVLSTGTSGPVTSTFDAATGVWTATGPIANVNTLLAGVTFTPTANFNANFTIATSVSDGIAAALTGSKVITGQAVNDAPQLGDGTLAAVPVNTTHPPGQTVAVIFTGQFTDPDAGSSLAGIAVVGNAADAGTQGVWQYSSNAGTDWFAIGAVADDPTALAIAGGALVRFVPVAGFSGAPAPLIVRGLDDTYAGGFSTTAETESRVTVNTLANGGATCVAAVVANLATTISEPTAAPPVDVPLAFAFDPAWPNPSQGALTLRFALPSPAHVSVVLLDTQGRRVATLADGDYAAGRYTVPWEGRTDSRLVAPGIYFARLATAGHTSVRRVVITR